MTSNQGPRLEETMSQRERRHFWRNAEAVTLALLVAAAVLSAVLR